MHGLGVEARKASALISRASTTTKNTALKAIGEEILANRTALMTANEKDLDAGRNNDVHRGTIYHDG